MGIFYASTCPKTRRELIEAQNFPMIYEKISSWSDLIELDLSKSSRWDRIGSWRDFKLELEKTEEVDVGK